MQQSWYKKLKKAGFDDHEKNEQHLKQYSVNAFKDDSAAEYEAKENYYRMAGQFLNKHRFSNNLERQIWDLHCKGIGIRDIAQRTGVYKFKTHATLQRLVKIMRGK